MRQRRYYRQGLREDIIDTNGEKKLMTGVERKHYRDRDGEKTFRDSDGEILLETGMLTYRIYHIRSIMHTVCYS